jgi:hypothetical protein
VHRVVDAMNVIGSRPDGWWKDRRGAIERFVELVDSWAGGAEERITVVLEQPPSRPIASKALEVIWAPRAAPNSADAEIVSRLPKWIEEDEDVIVVTSDGDLATRARSLGARVEGSSSFRRQLDGPS